jgi:hypothetical protein
VKVFQAHQQKSDDDDDDDDDVVSCPSVIVS